MFELAVDHWEICEADSLSDHKLDWYTLKMYFCHGLHEMFYIDLRKVDRVQK